MLSLAKKMLGDSSRQNLIRFIDANLKWEEDENATFDLHFNFGKISLDKSNRVVDRVNLRAN